MNASGSYGTLDHEQALSEAQRLQQQVGALWRREAATLAQVGMPRGARLLEVGCGSGAVLAQVRSTFEPRLAVGVEIDCRNAETARHVAPVVRGNGERLPFAEGSFDAVLFRFVLRHVTAPDRLLAEARRVLRPGGRVVVVDADDASFLLDNAPPSWPPLLQALVEAVERRGADPYIGRRLRRLLVEAGFGEVLTAQLPVSTDDLPAPLFVETLLAPTARPIDPDLLNAITATRAWSELRAWAKQPSAFGTTLGFFAGGEKKG